MANSTLAPGYPVSLTPQQPNVAQGGAIPEPVTASSLGAASGTVAIGSPAIGDAVNITINGHLVSYTLVTGDTVLATAIGHIVAALNADGTDSAIITASASSPNVVITAKANGTGGCYSLTASVTGSGGTTAVAGEPSLVISGSVNNVVPKSTFDWNYGGSQGVIPYYTGNLYYIDTTTATAMRAAGLVF